MCGVAFLFSGSAPAETASRIESALAQMTHRGPDEQGVATGEDWSIGHRRLSILDLSRSRQPMRSPDGNHSLSFNGEIYNFRELRKALEAHWQFQTDGDTEVLLAGLVIHGHEFLPRLRGMWSFALWNNRTRQLLIARDRMGKKPLYYTCGPSEFACASELPALFSLTSVTPAEDLDGTADFLRYGFYLPGHTAYEGVKELAAGCYAYWSPGNELSCTPYWSLDIGTYAGSHSQACDEIRTNITTAVERRLVSDVDIGLLLSGGIDSSLIAALVAGRFNLEPKAFTVGFEANSYDERHDAKAVARANGLDHYEEIFPDFHPDDLGRLIAGSVGQPFGDASILPTSCAYALAGRHVKVVLSGDGADELFSGYQRYQARLLFRYYRQVPAGLRSLITATLKVFDEPQGHHSRSVVKKAKLFTRQADRGSVNETYIAPTALASDTLNRLAPELKGRSRHTLELPDLKNTDDVLQMMATDARVYLPQDILTKVDRASMMHSVESRSPFLDADVVDLAFKLPRSWNRRGLMGKRMLRESFGRLLPAQTWKKRKQGFAVPLPEWFQGTLGDQLTALNRELPDSPISATVLASLLAEHRSRQADHSMGLWNLFSYLHWKVGLTAGHAPCISR